MISARRHPLLYVVLWLSFARGRDDRNVLSEHEKDLCVCPHARPTTRPGKPRRRTELQQARGKTHLKDLAKDGRGEEGGVLDDDLNKLEPESVLSQLSR